MKGDTVYRVYGVKADREKDSHFGTFVTEGEAEAQIIKVKGQHWHGGDYKQYHDEFEIRPHTVDVDFVIPPGPTPRKRFTVTTESIPQGPGVWNKTSMTVHNSVPEDRVITTYERNYAPLRTFEPFRQGEKFFALVSPDYTGTSVMDLQTGEIIAEEEHAAGGFCPVGFYVPDWWDLHDESIIPGSPYWSTGYEQPDGTFGFVWGCHWGDDGSWKCQFLDLSKIQEGIIARDDRFGYVELATISENAKDFIHVWFNSNGAPRIRLAVEMTFDMGTGTVDDHSVRGLTDPKFRSFVRPGEQKEEKV